MEDGMKPGIPEYQDAPYYSGYPAQAQPAPAVDYPALPPAPPYQAAVPQAPQYNYPPAGPPPQPLQPAPVQQQQQQNTNVVVVGQQTAAPVVIETNSVGDHFLTLSVIMLILSVCCGTIFLVCTIPAVLLASSARDDDRCGRPDSAQVKGRIALGLNIATVVSWLSVVLFNIIIIVAVSNAARSSTVPSFNG